MDDGDKKTCEISGNLFLYLVKQLKVESDSNFLKEYCKIIIEY